MSYNAALDLLPDTQRIPVPKHCRVQATRPRRKEIRRVTKNSKPDHPATNQLKRPL